MLRLQFTQIIKGTDITGFQGSCPGETKCKQDWNYKIKSYELEDKVHIKQETDNRSRLYVNIAMWPLILECEYKVTKKDKRVCNRDH